MTQPWCKRAPALSRHAFTASIDPLRQRRSGPPADVARQGSADQSNRSWALDQRLENILIEDVERYLSLSVALVKAGIDYDHKVERWRDVQTLTTKADADNPVDLAIAYERAVQPKLISVGSRRN